MEKKLVIDIIIPAYNPGGSLRDAINSCLSQTYKNYKITVIDDCSTEDVESLVNDFENINYLRNNKNLGPGASRNIGIRNTSGDLISMLDADDIMHKNKLELSIKEFEKNKDIGMTCGNYRILVNRKRLMAPFYKMPIKIGHRELMRQNYVASGSVTMKRSVIEDVGLFDEKYWIAEDYDMWLRISEKYPISYIHDILYYYSVLPGGSSLTQRSDIQKKHMDNIAKIKKASQDRILKNKND
tara:strand:- start:2407 stop:3129 length:723 start_codon:yes stop_codon:yes gene_type:complete